MSRRGAQRGGRGGRWGAGLGLDSDLGPGGRSRPRGRSPAGPSRCHGRHLTVAARAPTETTAPPAEIPQGGRRPEGPLNRTPDDPV